MKIRLALWMAAPLALATSVGAMSGASTPFDERTLGRIQHLNRAITDHYEKLQSTSSQLEAERETTMERVGAAREELEELASQEAELLALPEDAREQALRRLEQRRIDAKSRSLEALAEKHAIDVEALASFEEHGTAILTNLEHLGQALEKSGRFSESTDPVTRTTLHSVQRGTAIALATLEEWGAIGRDDPRFRALWATARVLGRHTPRLQGPQSLGMTLGAVRQRAFVVRSLIDQARAMRAQLDQQGLLLQVAAQNQMLRLNFVRLGAINGLQLPDLRIEESFRYILEDVEEQPYTLLSSGSEDLLQGFEDCLELDQCM